MARRSRVPRGAVNSQGQPYACIAGSGQLLLYRQHYFVMPSTELPHTQSVVHSQWYSLSHFRHRVWSFVSKSQSKIRHRVWCFVCQNTERGTLSVNHRVTSHTECGMLSVEPQSEVTHRVSDIVSPITE